MEADNLGERGLSIPQYAKTVFGSDALAQEWLAKNHVLLGAAPKVLISTPEGEQEVRRILASIEHGLPV